MCMRPNFMFLSTAILGPNSPGQNIDVCLQPLSYELTQLWSSRTLTYDVSRKQNFQMKVTLMWTINDFPAYGIVSDWSTHGKLTCPYCMENNKAFMLTNSGKASFFYCYRQFLSTDHKYRKTSLLKGMLHHRFFQVKNYTTWFWSTVTLCLVFNLVRKHLLVFV